MSSISVGEDSIVLIICYFTILIFNNIVLASTVVKNLNSQFLFCTRINHTISSLSSFLNNVVIGARFITNNLIIGIHTRKVFLVNSYSDVLLTSGSTFSKRHRGNSNSLFTRIGISSLIRFSSFCYSKIKGFRQRKLCMRLAGYDQALSELNIFSSINCRSTNSKDRDCHCQNHRQCTQATDGLLQHCSFILSIQNRNFSIQRVSQLHPLPHAVGLGFSYYHKAHPSMMLCTGAS